MLLNQLKPTIVEKKEIIEEVLNLQSIGLDSTQIMNIMLHNHIHVKEGQTKVLYNLLNLGYIAQKMGDQGKFKISR